MIEMVLAHADLAHMRFAHSPVRELAASIRALQSNQAGDVYGAWRSDVGGRLGGVNLDLLTSLAPAGPVMPSFFMPRPTKPWTDISDEFDAIASVDPSAIRKDLEDVYSGGRLPPALRPLYDDPTAHLPAIVDELYKYWNVAIEPMWPSLRALTAADLVYRAEQFASGGLGTVLAGLHAKITLHEDTLRIGGRGGCHHRFDLAGTGLVLIPCVFLWPTLLIECCDTQQPSVTYPVRGIAGLLAEDRRPGADPLFALVGRSRARLLRALTLPQTTTQLAEQFALTPAAVSQHLKILKAAGLASSRRRGQLVLYQRTQAALALIKASDGVEISN
jgi:DNA-binding transcriptional ArsR family regulator